MLLFTSHFPSPLPAPHRNQLRRSVWYRRVVAVSKLIRRLEELCLGFNVDAMLGAFAVDLTGLRTAATSASPPSFVERGPPRASVVALIDGLHAAAGVRVILCRWGVPLGLGCSAFFLAAAVMLACSLPRNTLIPC